MKTQGLEGLLQGAGLVQGTSPQYNNISFEDILLEAFDGVGLDEQVSFEGLGQKEPSDLSGKSHYTQTLSEILGMMMVSQTGVGGAQTSLDTDISNHADAKEAQISSDANISRDGVFNTSVFEKASGGVEKQLINIEPLEDSKEDGIQIDGFIYHQKPTSEAGLSVNVSQEHERPIVEAVVSQVKNPMAFQEGNTRVSDVRYYQESTSGLEAGLSVNVSQEHERPIVEAVVSQVKNPMAFQEGNTRVSDVRYYQESTSGLEAGLSASVSQEHERPITQELYGYVEMVKSERGREQKVDAISRPQEQVKKALSEEPSVGKELSSIVDTQPEEYTHGNVHVKTFDQSRMFYGEIKQNNNAKFEKDKVQENKSLREASFETNADYTNFDEPQKTFQNKAFSQEPKLVYQEGKNLEHFNLKDYGEEENKGDRDPALGKEGKGMELLAKETISTTRSKEDVPQRVERVERPQTQPFHEAKHINIRFEEGSIRIMLSGDRLRLSMNLSEEFYRPPTALEVQRLVQSLQSIGLNPEMLKLNGNNLYNSEYRQGSKREDKERHNLFSVQDPSEEPIKNFSLYL